MRLLIVIVNYRTADLAIDCLRSLESQIETGTRVIVTDNASGDGSIERIADFIQLKNYAWAATQPLPSNSGFAYGNNEAIRPALQSPDKPQYVLLLNPDTIVHPGAISELLKFMDENPKAGIAGSRLEDPDGTPQISAFNFHSIASEFERGIRLGIVTKLLAKSVVPQPVPTTNVQCDWVCGASMIVRREVFEQAGLMDDKYFMYFEEVDFCLAALKKGWTCWYVKASRVIHLVGAASQLSDARKHRKRRPTFWFDSRRRYFVKNHGVIYTLFADTAFAIGFAFWRLRRLIQRKPDPDPPKMLGDFIRNSVVVRGATL